VLLDEVAILDRQLQVGKLCFVSALRRLMLIGPSCWNCFDF